MHAKLTIHGPTSTQSLPLFRTYRSSVLVCLTCGGGVDGTLVPISSRKPPSSSLSLLGGEKAHHVSCTKMAERYGTWMDTKCTNICGMVIEGHREKERSDLIMAATRTSTSSVGGPGPILLFCPGKNFEFSYCKDAILIFSDF